MGVPKLTTKDVKNILPDLKNVLPLPSGGQKQVFSCEIHGRQCVIKFLLLTPSSTGHTSKEAIQKVASEILSRAEREIETLAQINTPTFVKLGPIGLTLTIFNGQQLIYFTEERIDGKDLKAILSDQGLLSVEEGKRLCLDISEAIDNLWAIGKIHRDIKPGNIIRSDDTGSFVLLDPGIVFDLEDVSLTPTPNIVGTLGYHSPEQLNYKGRRSMDFRSDLFSLGTVLYESLTGQNPFAINCTSKDEIMNKTLFLDPPRPNTIRTDIPDFLDEVIVKMLRKQPHMRFNSCTALQKRIRCES